MKYNKPQPPAEPNKYINIKGLCELSTSRNYYTDILEKIRNIRTGFKLNDDDVLLLKEEGYPGGSSIYWYSAKINPSYEKELASYNKQRIEYDKQLVAYEICVGEEEIKEKQKSIRKHKKALKALDNA
jgi:hypothetical protein